MINGMWLDTSTLTVLLLNKTKSKRPVTHNMT